MRNKLLRLLSILFVLALVAGIAAGCGSSTSFAVDSLTLTPTRVGIGQPATVEATVTNTGTASSTYNAELKVNGKTVGKKETAIAAGEKKTISFRYMADAQGSFKVELSGLVGTLEVVKAAALKARSLKVSPALVFPGRAATVEAEVTNTGEAQGSVNAVLTVNGVETDSKPVTLDAGASGKVTFSVVRDMAGKYDLVIGTEKAVLTVAEAKAYTSTTYYYTISYPGEWVLNQAESARVMMERPGEGQLVIDTQRLPVNFSQQQFASLTLDNNAKRFQDWKLVSQSEVKKDGAIAAYRCEFSYTLKGTKFKGINLLLKRGRWSYAISGEMQEPDWERNRSALEACLDSFKPPVVAVGFYINTTNGYALTLPEGWDCMDFDGSVRAESPVGQQRVLVDVSVRRVSQVKLARDYAYDDISSLKTRPKFAIVSEGDIKLNDGTKGYDIVVSYNYSDIPYKQRLIEVLRGTQVLKVAVTALADGYDKLLSSIDQLIRSFTLVAPRPFGASTLDSIFCWQGTIATLDPATIEESPADIVGALFSGLVKIDKELKIVPDIAEKWDVSADGRTYTFHLRGGVKFHNGKPVTAQDFKYSWERACDPKTESNRARAYLGDIVGATEMLAGKANEIKGVSAPDDRTLEVAIDGPKPSFLNKLAQPVAYVVDKANVESGKSWEDEPNGTGPFKLKQWKKDELLVLERNEYFYLQPARLKNIVFRLLSSRPVTLYERGEIDVADVGLSDLEKVQDSANPLSKDLTTIKSIGSGYIGFNVSKPPFDDANVRRAFALALDMDKLLDVSLKGQAERAGGLLPPGIPGYNADLKPLPFDPGQAKQLISQSKYGSVERLPPVTFSVRYGAGSLEKAMLSMWQQNLGVEVKVEAIQELKEWYERSRRHEFQLFTQGWRADYIDPQNFLELMFQSQNDLNMFDYSSPGVDKALKDAAAERDDNKRIKRYQEIEAQILKDLPAVPLYHSRKVYALVRPWIKGLQLYPIGVNIWKDISVEAH